MSDAFFMPEGDGFQATVHTRGPWSSHHQHGGPPLALLVRAIEREPTPTPMHTARVTAEFQRPIPIAHLTVSVETLRPGKKVRVVRASLCAGGEVVAQATAVLIRKENVPLPAGADAGLEHVPIRSIADSTPWVIPFFPDPVGYHTAIEGRVAAGAYGTGHMCAWMRPRFPLVPGEVMSGTQRAILFADAAHGMSAPLDLTRFTFINPDLTLYLHREPQGEWLSFDARTLAEPLGVGLAHTRIGDEAGPAGLSAQCLIIEAR